MYPCDVAEVEELFWQDVFLFMHIQKIHFLNLDPTKLISKQYNNK